MTSSSSMAQPIAVILLIVAIAPGLAVAGSSSSVINATCAALTNLQPFDSCVGVLSADPAAAVATDIRGLAAAAVNITAVKAASTLSVITYLVQDLNTCRKYYSNMLRSLANITVDIGAGRFRNASDEMGDATGYPMGCDILLFEGNAHKDPISEENSENDTLVYLVADIINLIRS